MMPIIFIIILVLGAPIAMVIGATTLITFWQNGIRPEVMARMMYGAVDSFGLMAIPFFIFAGDLMVKGGVSRRLVKFANVCVGWVTGGIPVTAVLSCLFFSALSGSSPATVAGIGSVMIPNMVENKYPKKFTVGLICAAGSLGIILPPSITMMTYGVVSGVSISALFLASVLPGIFIGIVLILVATIYAKVKNFERMPKPTIKEVGVAFKDAVWSLLMPLFILGAIYSGIATPTEAAALSIIYAMVISLFVYKEMKLLDLFVVSKKSVVQASMIMFVISTAQAFSWLLTFERIPAQLLSAISGLTESRFLLLLVLNIFMLLIGTFLNPTAKVLILTPLFLPLVTAVGVSPVHFGVIMIVNFAIGMLTPPLGLNLFVAMGIGKMSLTEVIKGALPFVIILIGALMVITYVPWLSMILL